MQRVWYAAVLILGLAASSGEAQACRIDAPLKPGDIRYADVVVMGRIANYEIVLDQQARQDRKDLLARSPDMPAEVRKSLQSQTEFMSDYARFTVIVDEVLVGKAPKTLTVTWDNSTFDEPETMAPGRYLVALRNSKSASPPLRGPSATILASRQPELPTVLQAPCAPPFIFEAGSQEELTVRGLLSARRQSR